MKKMIEEKAKKFFATLSVHGVPRIVKTDRWLIKLIWIVMITTSISAGVYIISKSVKDFYRYDVITNIERVRPDRVTFPAVAICKLNMFRKSIYKNLTLIGSELTSEVSLKNFIRNYESPNGDKNISNLEVFQISQDGRTCLRFNGASIKKNLEIVNSTKLALSLEFNEKFIYWLSARRDANVYKGIETTYQVFIGDNYLNSYMRDVLNFGVLPENLHNIKIETTDIEEKLEEPYNQCMQAGVGGETYIQMNCVEKCLNRVIKAKYNCSIPSFYRVNGLRKCFEQFDRKINYKFDDQLDALINEFYVACKMECPKQCQSKKMIIRHSEISVQGQGYTGFGFSLDELSFFKITQIPKMNTFSLIASIGGSLGLFIGARFLSLVEIMEFIIDVLYILLTDRFNYIN